MRAAITLAVLIGTVGTACGQTGPVIAIPGRPGVPVIINGVDASYAVVEGDWGLAKGVQIPVTVYGGHPIDPGPPIGHYYPSAGHLPGYGRLEIEGAAKPKPAQTFHQSWSAGSRQADPPVPLNQVPQYPPPVMMAPQFNAPQLNEHGLQQNSAIPQQTPAPPQQTAPPTQPETQRAPPHRP
jgi:hypothetical protein